MPCTTIILTCKTPITNFYSNAINTPNSFNCLLFSKRINLFNQKAIFFVLNPLPNRELLLLVKYIQALFLQLSTHLLMLCFCSDLLHPVRNIKPHYTRAQFIPDNRQMYANPKSSSRTLP